MSAGSNAVTRLNSVLAIKGTFSAFGAAGAGGPDKRNAERVETLLEKQNSSQMLWP